MHADRTRPALWISGAIVALIGIALAYGGIRLIMVGGSWYYALVAAGFVVTGLLLILRRSAAFWLYAAIVLGTLAWALWEVGLDWWALAPRGDVVFLVGLLLLMPWITRPIALADPVGGRSVWRGGAGALALTLVLAAIVAVLAWFTPAHDLEGSLPQARIENPPLGGNDIPAGEWHAYGRTEYGQRYAPLAQITPENVDELEVAWHYHTGDTKQPGDTTETTYEVTPLKIGDTLYICTPHHLAIALDAETGEERWRYDAGITPQGSRQHQTCRGLSYYDAPGAPADESCARRLFLPTGDARLIALDPETGEECPGFGENGHVNLWANMPHTQEGFYYSTSPPVVANGVVIIGGAVNDNVSTTEPSGVVRAYDAVTGDLMWNFDPGNLDATEPIAEGETYSANSPNNWTVSAADPALGLVYVPFGNQPPDQWGGNRPEDTERFSSSIVALDIATGQVRWVFQTVHHDLWDYDVPSQPSLLNLVIDNESVPALVQPTKQGEVYVLNRETGEPILPVTENPVPQGAAEGDTTAPTQPVSALSFDPPPLRESDMWGATPFDQLACRIAFRQYRYEGRYTPPSTQGSLVYPGNFGVFNWGAAAVDPQRQILFGSPGYLAFVSKLIPREDAQTNYVSEGKPGLNENYGAPFAAELKPFTQGWTGLPCQQPPWGYVAGADLTTGDIVWMHRNGTVRDRSPLPLPFRMGVPDLGGPLLTAGGVAFLSGTLDYYVRAYDVTTGEQLWESRLPAGGQATPMSFEGRDGRQYVVVVAGGHGSLGTKTGDSVIAYALPQ